ncbi:MAG: MMPL family transporter [Gammaproteobacteria bacterium]|nr:MMPL family transporter [Gammaproteobacteria bacterium]
MTGNADNDEKSIETATVMFMDSFAGAASRWIMRYYLIIIVVTAVVTAASFQLAADLKLNADIFALMPDGVASVDNLNQVMKKTGSFSNAMVVVESPDPAAAIRFLRKLRKQALKHPWVRSAEYTEDTSVFQRHKLLYMETADLREIQRRINVRVDYEKRHPNITFRNVEIKISTRKPYGPKSTDKTKLEISAPIMPTTKPMSKTQRESGRNGRKDNPTIGPPPLEFDDIEAKYQRKQGHRDKTRSSERVFQSDDGLISILLVWPRGETNDIGFSRHFINDLSTLVETVDPSKYHPRMQVDIGGLMQGRVMGFDAVMNDLRSSALWSISAILLLLTFYYRRLFSILYIGLPLIMGILWTFGITQLILGGLNLITVFLVVVLFGLGVDFGIHNLTRYDEVRRCGGSLEEALTIVFRRTGMASFMAAITTIAGFYALLVTDFRAFFEFGFIAGTGVALIFLSMYLVFPALMLLAERIGLYRVSVPQIDVCNVTREGFPKPRAVLFVTLAVLVVSLFYGNKIHYEDDFNKLNTKIPRYEAVKQKINKVFPLVGTAAVIFVPTLEEVAALVKHLNYKIATDDESPTIKEVKSIYTIVPSKQEQDERLAIIRSIKLNTEEITDYINDEQRTKLTDILDYLDIDRLSARDLPPALRRLYTGLPGSGGYLIYIYDSVSLSDLTQAKAYSDDIRELTVNGKTYYPATEALIFVDMRDLMRNDAAIAVFAVSLVIILVLLVNFRSLRKVFIVVFPVVTGMIMMAGIMGIFDIRLSIFNMVVLPTIVGIGVDNGIHIFHRYEEEGARSLRHVIRTTGWAVAITTLTTLFGFAGMLSAANPGLQSLGILACIGLSTCLVSSLILLPVLLQWMENRGIGPKYELGQTTSFATSQRPTKTQMD